METSTDMRVTLALILLIYLIGSCSSGTTFSQIDNDCGRVRTMMIFFYKSRSSWPTNPKQLYAACHSTPLIDPWGRQYELELMPNVEKLVLTSRGPDRTFNTRDDVRRLFSISVNGNEPSVELMKR